MALLEPAEQIVASLLAQGKTNEQIAAQLGFLDKRTISRVNGQIYAAWDLSRTATDEKIARTRALRLSPAPACSFVGMKMATHSSRTKGTNGFHGPND